MTGTSLVIANHANDVEVLTWVDLIVCLLDVCLMDNTLSKLSKQLPRDTVRDTTVTGWFFEANCVIQTRQVTGSCASLKLFKVKRFDLANQRILILQTIGRS